jgi:hypothetical protein
MQATRVIKTVEHTDLDELASYLGQKVEIIILPLTEEIEQAPESELEGKRRRFFEIIDQCAGHLKLSLF